MNALTRLSLVSLWILVLPGCVVGPGISSLAPVRTGQGIDLVFSTLQAPDVPAYRNVSAELLEVRDDALLVRTHQLRPESVMLVSYRAIAEARIEGLKRLSFGNGGGPSRAQRAELRLLSRFPQGVSDELLGTLLAAYDQNELRTIP